MSTSGMAIAAPGARALGGGRLATGQTDSRADEAPRDPNDRTNLALALTSAKVGLETGQKWLFDRTRTSQRFLHFWKGAAPAARPVAIASALVGVAAGAPLVFDGARDFAGKLVEGRDPFGQALGTGEGIQGLGKLVAGTSILAAGLLGPRIVKSIRSGGPGGTAMRNVLLDFVRGPTVGTTPVTGKWGALHGASQFSSLATSGLIAGTAVANAESAVQDRGPGGLAQTKPGRSALVLGATAAAFGAFHVLAAFNKARPAGMSRLLATVNSPWLMHDNVRSWRTGIGFALGAGFIANEAGLLDRFNSDR